MIVMELSTARYPHLPRLRHLQHHAHLFPTNDLSEGQEPPGDLALVVIL